MRADGSPKMTMAINIVGAVVNTVLDAIFVFGFGWGMTGAAAATVIGQVIASIMVIVYLSHYKTVPLHRDAFCQRQRSSFQLYRLARHLALTSWQ